MKKIIIYPNADIDSGFEMTLTVYKMLRERGRKAIFCPMVYEDGTICSTELDITKFKLDPAVIEHELPNAEMVITIGGDGTMLRAARITADSGVPILGINMGGKGFLAELECEDISLINSAADGKYKIESRMMIDIEILRDNEQVYKDFALNDVVIKGDNKVIDLTLSGDNQRITRFSGDGTVIATPTGSTAYSMSAGGPLVEPLAQNIIITPICAHILTAKSIVLASERCVTVEIGTKKHNPAYMSVDGGKHTDVHGGDIINIRKSKLITKLIRIKEKSFYQTVSEKF